METTLPWFITYETTDPVPVDDVIQSLLGISQVVRELPPLLEAFIPGLYLEKFSLSISQVSQFSPLREAFLVGVIAIYQDKIAEDLPKLINDLFGIHLPHESNNIVSVLVLALIFYSVDHLFEYIFKDRSALPNIRRQLNGLISEVAQTLSVSEEAVKARLDERYNLNRTRHLLKAVSQLIRPAKNQNNSAMTVSGRVVDGKTISEFPGDAQLLEALAEDVTSSPLLDTEILLHAQDVDHDKQGWAAVVPEISPKRIRMHLYPPIVPTDLYTKERIRGDLIVESKRNSAGRVEPVRVHLLRITDRPPKTSPATLVSTAWINCPSSNLGAMSLFLLGR